MISAFMDGVSHLHKAYMQLHAYSIDDISSLLVY